MTDNNDTPQHPRRPDWAPDRWGPWKVSPMLWLLRAVFGTRSRVEELAPYVRDGRIVTDAPVSIRFAGPDDDLYLVDGLSSLDALVELGVPVYGHNGDIVLPKTLYRLESLDVDPDLAALQLNLGWRKPKRSHYQQLVTGILRLHPEWSDGRIADAIGVDHKTVGSRRADLIATREIPDSNKREGLDGRTRRVPQPRDKQDTQSEPGTDTDHHPKQGSEQDSDPQPDDTQPGLEPEPVRPPPKKSDRRQCIWGREHETPENPLAQNTWRTDSPIYMCRLCIIDLFRNLVRPQQVAGFQYAIVIEALEDELVQAWWNRERRKQGRRKRPLKVKYRREPPSTVTQLNRIMVVADSYKVLAQLRSAVLRGDIDAIGKLLRFDPAAEYVIPSPPPRPDPYNRRGGGARKQRVKPRRRLFTQS